MRTVAPFTINHPGQLPTVHLPGTTNWSGGWYGERPSNLLDPTGMMQQLFGM
jgi:hypothetical protein